MNLGAVLVLMINEALAVGIVALALIAFYAAKAVRRRQGVDLDLIYAEIPPE